MTHPLFFYLLAALAVASALGVILARNPANAVLSLVVTLFTLSGLFLSLEAYFVAAIQVILYAGAILVLFLFVVMLLDMAPPPDFSATGGSHRRGEGPFGPKSGGGMAPEALFRIKGGSLLRFLGAVSGLFFLGQLLPTVRRFAAGPSAPTPAVGTTAGVGRELFTTYALPFEVASGLLLVGIIGAVVLAKKKVKGEG